MNRKLLIGTGVAAAVVIGVATSSTRAALVIKLTSGSSTQTITDNGPGDTNPLVGQIAFAGSVGAFSTVITSGLSNSPGATDGAFLQNQSISVRDTTSTKATLTISMSDTGFTNPMGNGLTEGSAFAGTFLSGSAGESATFQSYVGTDNAAFSTTATTGVQTLTLASGSPFPNSQSSADKTVGFNANSAYSLSQVTTINLSAKGQANLAGTTSVGAAGGSVPEPASLSILGMGLALLAARRRRRA